MLIKYTDSEYNSATSKDLLALECECCGKTFYAPKKAIKYEQLHERGRLKYCSKSCCALNQKTSHKCYCENCGIEINVIDSVYKSSPNKHFFCSSSCSATYNNKQRECISQETRDKISKSVIEHYKKNTKKNKHMQSLWKGI